MTLYENPGSLFAANKQHNIVLLQADWLLRYTHLKLFPSYWIIIIIIIIIINNKLQMDWHPVAVIEYTEYT